MTKKGLQKFWWMKIENFVGKRSKWGNFPRSSKIFSEIEGKSETGWEMYHCLRGMTPLNAVLSLARLVTSIRALLRLCKKSTKTAVRFPTAAYFRDLNFGLARSFHADLKINTKPSYGPRVVASRGARRGASPREAPS